MKQSLLIFALGILFLSSCESYPEVLENKQVFYFDVKAKDWVKNSDRDGLNTYYSCHFKVKGLNTCADLDHCAALGFICLGSNDQALPYTRHYENKSGDAWTQTVDFDYSLSEVNFYVTDSDFAGDRPEKMSFRIMYIW